MLIICAPSRSLLNGGFETGDPPSYWLPNAGPTLSQSATDPHGGTYCINAVRGTADIVAYQDVILVIGVGYTVGFWGKNVDATNVAIDIYQDGWNYVKGVGASAATSWTEKTTTFTADSINYRFCLKVTGTAGQIGRFDDVTLVVTP